MAFRKRSRNVRRRGRKIRKVSRKRTSKVVRAVRNMAETKLCSYQYFMTSFNAAIASSTDLLRVMPYIIQGTGQGDRIGNRISPVKIVVRGVVSAYLSEYQYAWQIGVRMFMFCDKVNPSGQIAINNYAILNNGGVSSNFSGAAMDYTTPHNTDQFKWLKDKRWVVFKPWGYTNTAVPSVTADMTSPGQNLVKYFTIVVLKKKMPKTLCYDATYSSNLPVNFNPKLALGYCDMLNFGADTVNTKVRMEYTSTLYYKDL